MVQQVEHQPDRRVVQSQTGPQPLDAADRHQRRRFEPERQGVCRVGVVGDIAMASTLGMGIIICRFPNRVLICRTIPYLERCRLSHAMSSVVFSKLLSLFLIRSRTVSAALPALRSDVRTYAGTLRHVTAPTTQQ